MWHQILLLLVITGQATACATSPETKVADPSLRPLRVGDVVTADATDAEQMNYWPGVANDTVYVQAINNFEVGDVHYAIGADNRPAILITLVPPAAVLWREYTGCRIKKEVALIAGDHVIWSGAVLEPLGGAMYVGPFYSEDSAREVMDWFKSK